MHDAGFRLASFLMGLVLLLVLLWAAWGSVKEGERIAPRRLVLLAALLPLAFFGLALVPGAVGEVGSLLLVSASVLAILVVALPFPGRGLRGLGDPVPGVDERDIMFSRATLVPGTDRFEEYYKSRPENLEPDDKFRREPGLLSPGSAHYHLQGFAAADAAFWTIEMMRPFADGPGPDSAVDANPDERSAGTSSAGEFASTNPDGPPARTKLGGEPIGPNPDKVVPSDSEAMTRFLKGWTLKMGAYSVGVTELRDYHLYTHVGRGPEYGRPVTLDHTFAMALTVEMDKEMVDRAPRSPTAMESAFQYLRAGTMAIQVADLIRRLGYRARAHVDGHYRVICPLVARDAGLGEFGRMGLLMTPGLGPRVRIAVVTTDIPLVTDPLAPDLTTIDFCSSCMKCADSCPSRAISFGDPEEDENGVRRWRIDSEACFTLWGRLGTDCARCMAVCPYSHPDNPLHSIVRWGIRNNVLFRKGALRMDDLIYGRRPPPKEALEWMKFPESEKGVPRTTL